MKPIFEAAVRFGTWTKNFLNHLFYLLYGKPLGNSTHIVPTCNISRIFSCFLSSFLMSTYSKVIFWLPKIWALGSWNAKIDWYPCLPITLDCFKLKNRNQFWLSDLVVPRSSILYWELTLSKGSYFFYVDKILDFFDPPLSFVDILFSKIGIFLTPPPSLRVYVEKVCPLTSSSTANGMCPTNKLVLYI